MYKANPILGRFDFAFQLVGLVCLILNVSFSRLLSITIEFLATKNERKRRSLFYLKLFLLFIGLLYCAQLLSHMLYGYRVLTENPTRKETTKSLAEPENFHLIVCIPIEYILSEYGSDWYEYEYNYDPMSMLELEKATDQALNDTLDYIGLSYQDELIKIKWWVSPKVIFKTDRYRP